MTARRLRFPAPGCVPWLQIIRIDGKTRSIPQARPTASMETEIVFSPISVRPFRMILMAGHRRGAVIGYDKSGSSLVISDIQQSRNAGMKEGRIADDSYDLALFARFFDALRKRDSATHAQDDIGTGQGREYSKL
jgi:hypothetical protein